MAENKPNRPKKRKTKGRRYKGPNRLDQQAEEYRQWCAGYDAAMGAKQIPPAAESQTPEQNAE
jgi:hypothetical protein